MSFWKCAQCESTFLKSKLLESHSRHTKHKAYSCTKDPRCHKSFGLRTALIRHEASHSEHKKHICSHCNRGFHRRDHAQEHEDICHADRLLTAAPREDPRSAEEGAEVRAASLLTKMGSSNAHLQAQGDYHHEHWSTKSPAMGTPKDSNSLDHGSASSDLTEDLAALQHSLEQYQQKHPLASQSIPDPWQTYQLHAREPRKSSQPFQHNQDTSPFDAPSSSTQRRQATALRDYILELADPDRPSNLIKPGCKHPATFQCHLCPKRFTRAASRREHLRTHTDERPFVCTVCGLAFVRDHDRKRHEEHHNGEMKFRCNGKLETGASWGCGRRFARPDNLGRHFRSEAGRRCILPLLNEEAAKRRKMFHEEQQTQSQGFVLPAALLAQYPALAGIDWNTPPKPPANDYLSDFEGR